MQNEIVQTEFLCSCYYHAAREAASAVFEHELSESLQNSTTALILSQCALESYIDFMILSKKRHREKIEILDETSQRTEEKELIDVSIRDKWIHFPRIENSSHFKHEDEPFIHFSELVNPRNSILHLNSIQLDLEKNLPHHIDSLRDLIDFMKDEEWLSARDLERIIRYGIAGPLIVQNMIEHLHQMLDTEAPTFLNGEKVVA